MGPLVAARSRTVRSTPPFRPWRTQVHKGAPDLVRTPFHLFNQIVNQMIDNLFNAMLVSGKGRPDDRPNRTEPEPAPLWGRGFLNFSSQGLHQGHGLHR